MKAKLTFTEDLLGTLPGDPEVAKEFILSKRPDKPAEDEQDCLPAEEQVEKASTVFARDGDKIILWDYQIKGFLKEACRVMNDTETMTKAELKNLRLGRYMYKRTIDGMVFVKPRKIIVNLPDDYKQGFLERPLRAETMKGERIALARSEVVPAGSSIDIEIKTLNPKLNPFIDQWLTYGALRGLGAWRNASYGRFDWVCTEPWPKPPKKKKTDD